MHEGVSRLLAASAATATPASAGGYATVARTFPPLPTYPRYRREMDRDETQAAYAEAHIQVGRPACPHGVELSRYGYSTVCGVCASPWLDSVPCSHCRRDHCPGPRYVCLSCVGYVTCQGCNDRNVHSQHGMLQVKHTRQVQSVRVSLPPPPPLVVTESVASVAAVVPAAVPQTQPPAWLPMSVCQPSDMDETVDFGSEAPRNASAGPEFRY